MTVVSLVNQKGGCGKSTTAVHFVYYLNKTKKKVCLIDSDAQQSSSKWLLSIENIKIPTFAILNPEELFELIEELKKEFDYIIVDGPGSLSEITKTILDCSDLSLIPCQPSGLDLSSSDGFLRIVRQRQKIRNGLPKIALFLSKAIKGTILLRDTQESLTNENFPLLKSVIYQRQCLADAPIQLSTVFQLSGEAVKSASNDYKSLFKEALNLIG